jgi:hypothetical protein
MTAEERARKSVEAAVNRFTDGRYAVIVDADDNWPASVFSAAQAVKGQWEPQVEPVLERTMKKVGLEDAPADYDCYGMEAVMWHIQEMAREMFRDQLRRRGSEAADIEKHVRRITVGKWGG